MVDITELVFDEIAHRKHKNYSESAIKIYAKRKADAVKRFEAKVAAAAVPNLYYRKPANGIASVRDMIVAGMEPDRWYSHKDIQQLVPGVLPSTMSYDISKLAQRGFLRRAKRKGYGYVNSYWYALSERGIVEHDSCLEKIKGRIERPEPEKPLLGDEIVAAMEPGRWYVRDEIAAALPGRLGVRRRVEGLARDGRLRRERRGEVSRMNQKLYSYALVR